MKYDQRILKAEAFNGKVTNKGKKEIQATIADCMESATLHGHISFSVLRKKQVPVGWKLLNLLRNGYLELRHE